MNVNKLFVAGRLTRDPQVKFLPTQVAVCEFGIANNRRFRTVAGEDREEVLFVDCSAFGKTGEAIAQHFHKGKEIYLEGRLKLDQWDDKQTGAKRSKLTMVVDNWQFIGGKSDEAGDRQDDQQPAGDDMPGTQDPVRRPPPARQNLRGGGSAPGRVGLPDTEGGGQRAGSRGTAPAGDFDPYSDIPFAWAGRSTLPA